MVKNKTVVRRISLKLDNLLNGVRKKNNIKYIEASDLISDIASSSKSRRVIENIKREIEF